LVYLLLLYIDISRTPKVNSNILMRFKRIAKVEYLLEDLEKKV